MEERIKEFKENNQTLKQNKTRWEKGVDIAKTSYSLYGNIASGVTIGSSMMPGVGTF
ncbi:hypothetical protein RS022_01170 [Candidatus Phytoplasma rubi]|uniref:Uncharacterized protein n=1 Tax=Candidatus Phytoplasma rubi TaxID=399025 RepID=A0ABY7BRJ3_9MOLU|nr:hypothetical protein [Candidatus Phytoplasma rubi]WAN63115.1 hypothetical protein RS022_01170 [Candidatus Phytoplasma rubi]